jgi:hypothetical protein
MKIRNRILATAGAAALLASASLGAFATVPGDSADVDVRITTKDHATVSVQIAENGQNPFDDKPYSLGPQQSDGALIIQTVDDRGSAAGWHVSLKATDFMPTVATAPNAPIAISNLNLTAGAVTKVSTGGTTPGSGTNLTPVTTSLQLAWQAAAGTGDGIFSLDMDGALIIPAGTLVNTYTSTIYVEVADAP